MSADIQLGSSAPRKNWGEIAEGIVEGHKEVMEQKKAVMDELTGFRAAVADKNPSLNENDKKISQLILEMIQETQRARQTLQKICETQGTNSPNAPKNAEADQSLKSLIEDDMAKIIEKQSDHELQQNFAKALDLNVGIVDMPTLKQAPELPFEQYSAPTLGS